MTTLEPNLGSIIRHITSIDLSVSSWSFPPTKVMMAKHSSNYKKDGNEQRKFSIRASQESIGKSWGPDLVTQQYFENPTYWCLWGFWFGCKRFINSSNGFFKYLACLITTSNSQRQQTYKRIKMNIQVNEDNVEDEHIDQNLTNGMRCQSYLLCRCLFGSFSYWTKTPM